MQQMIPFLADKRDLTIVTNDFLARLVREKGGRAFVLPDPLPILEEREPADLEDAFLSLIQPEAEPDDATEADVGGAAARNAAGGGAS